MQCNEHVTSKMRFTNNRLTNLRIFKLRAYFEKLITNVQILEVPGNGWSRGHNAPVM